MYEKYARLLKKHKVSNYRIAAATGISQSTLSDWKRGRSVPKADKLKRIADYFNLPMDYFFAPDKE